MYGAGPKYRLRSHKMAAQAQDTSSGDPSIQVPGSEAEVRGKKKRSRGKVTLKKINYSDFNVHIVTWNVASFMPSASDIESLFLPQDGFMVTDLYTSADLIVIGLQEAYQNVQETLSSSIPVVGRDLHVDAFSSLLSKKGFARLTYCRLLGILTIVYVKQPLLCYIHSLATCTTKTGFNGWLGNKGAASIRFTLGDVSMCFTNCHLAPHTEDNEKRVLALKEIFRCQMFENGLTRLLDHDVTVLFGDLNFRIEKKDFGEVCQLVDEGQLGLLLNLDQLKLEQIKGDQSPSNLCYFMEMPITFAPSYKYKPGTDVFDEVGKVRTPSWCDRVLWNMHERRLPKITDWEPRNILQQEYYCMHKLPKLSDHKCVSAGMKVLVDISSYIPPIIFEVSEWICGVQGTIELLVAKDTEISMWDWVGLYPAHFSCLDRDSVFWVLTPARRGRALESQNYIRPLTPDQVPIEPGKYILVYKSHYYQRVLGMSPVFRILPYQS